MAVNCEMPFMATPEITKEFEAILKDILQELDSFVFAQPNAFSKNRADNIF